MTHKIPTTIITGFLGAGKTTLVRHVLANAAGRRIALIINEFGDVGVDRDVLAGCGDENCTEDDMIELANGCICCTVADEFIPTMQTLLARDNPPEHIIIETSGLALPQPLVRAFNWPEIKTRITIDGIVTVADAAALSEGRFAASEAAVDVLRKSDEMLDHDTPLGELFEDQLICADIVVLNKADLVSAPHMQKVREELARHMRPGTKIIDAQNGIIDVEVLLGLGLASEADIDNRLSHHEKDHDGVPHEHDDFDSFAFTMEQAQSRAQLIATIEQTIIAHDVLRLKGFAAIKGSAARLAVQAVGPRINTWFDRPWLPDERQETTLVVIGQSPLDAEAIRQNLRSGKVS
ncbi:MAG TPA: cobalamin biosynthesis protein CobW [Devosia sp.]|nr:cobalamin biosynthesis protein CobW [Devosia sp.]